MPTKPLDRLMFVQGGLCFFCKQPLSKSEASVEHLVASANGGGNGDDNCVACCKAVNAMLGNISLKEKFQVVLNQKGLFKCPAGAGISKAARKPKALTKAPMTANPGDGILEMVLSNLRQRGNARPRTLKTLTSTVGSLFPKGISPADLNALLEMLQSTGKVLVAEGKVTYTM